MILIKALVSLFVLMSLVALVAGSSDWAIYRKRGSNVLVAASGFLLVFWGSVLVFLASR